MKSSKWVVKVPTMEYLLDEVDKPLLKYEVKDFWGRTKSKEIENTDGVYFIKNEFNDFIALFIDTQGLPIEV